MKPSDFTAYPWGCVFYKSENETIAQNIMEILKRTGNEWRELSWDEYEMERRKDTNFSGNGKKYFDEVLEYTTSEEKARLFSPVWKATQPLT